ncbi:FOG: PPR repeat [Plasmopara halstedii]|uniref:FOG: PPR repeat n=1 Tax=Plasmopara halstedii TaxID=4781 RepID=A0A0P1AJ93_PLAHL|nr:FOG: PPR repeat [Plasmopara halstedii]CEG40935.1 FOG: PPR repeat [Plasmopara halstedii]|eukprot:XP_024577304.1 FOG: PPR repeat [Plasmopara halstedii]
MLAASVEIGNQHDVSSKLANLVEKCDASFPAIVWALDEQDWSQKNQPHQKAFFKSRNLMESIERALEKYDMNAAVRAPSSISRLSLNLDGKLLVLEELINAKSARLDDFNAVLGACGKQGWSADAKTVLNKMFVYAESFPHCAPTAWSFNALLNSCAAQGDVHELESILKDMINNELQPDQVTMNTLLKAFIKNLRKYNNGNNKKRFRTVVHALSFFKWCTEDLKLDPDAATFYSLFRLFSTYLETFDDSSVAVVYETETQMFDDFEENEEGDMVSQDRELMVWMSDLIATTCRDAPAAALDIGVFNNAFDYYRKLGDVDQTFALYNIMRKREIQPNDLTLGLLFATCAIQQQFEKGLKFLDHLMTSDGYMPSLKALTGAMQLYANARNPDGALGIIRAMETSKAFTLTTETYEPVVFAYARVGNVISAWEIAEEIQEKFGRVSINIYNRVLLACAEAALPGRALDVLSLIRSEENVTLDIISFNTTLDAFVRAGMRAAWSRKTHKYTLESDEQANYAEHKRVDNRNGYEHEMDGEYQRGRMVNSDNSDQTIEIEGKELEATLLRKDELNQRMKAAWVRASVIGLLEEMQEIRVKPDLTSYEHAIAACNVNKDFEGVIAIFDRLIRRKRCNDVIDLKSKLVSESSLAAYISACTATRDKNRIVEAPTLLHKWHLATGNIPPEFVVTQLLKSLETLGEWRCAVRMLPDWQVLFGIPPGVAVFNKVMEMCNNAEKHELVAPIFITMQGLAVYRIIPDVDSYIERIYAEEQRENWVIATDLFVEMQQRFSTEEISHYQLRKLNLGRYSLRQKEH